MTPLISRVALWPHPGKPPRTRGVQHYLFNLQPKRLVHLLKQYVETLGTPGQHHDTPYNFTSCISWTTPKADSIEIPEPTIAEYRPTSRTPLIGISTSRTRILCV
jgi:hypothetical protein